MKCKACMQEKRRDTSANILPNNFRNFSVADFGDFFTKSSGSIGYPLDEDGNYPEGWF